MFYDITIPIKNDMILYPGDRDITIEQLMTIDKDGANMTGIKIDSHTGTHLDAPLHFVSGGKSIDQFPTDLMVTTAKVFETDIEMIDKSYQQGHSKCPLQTGSNRNRLG